MSASALFFAQIAANLCMGSAVTPGVSMATTDFIAHFGCTPSTCSKLWNRMSLLFTKDIPIHLLWLLLWLYQYSNLSFLAKSCGPNAQTFVAHTKRVLLAMKLHCSMLVRLTMCLIVLSIGYLIYSFHAPLLVLSYGALF